ncbi:MAG TPA: hypothetical protein VIV59_13460, partial [Anaeromyxobacteraceae bacterium]
MSANGSRGAAGLGAAGSRAAGRGAGGGVASFSGTRVVWVPVAQDEEEVGSPPRREEGSGPASTLET